MGIFPGKRRSIGSARAHIELTVPTEEDSYTGVLGDQADAVVQHGVVDEYIVNVRQGVAVPDATRDGIDLSFTWTLTPHDGSRCPDTVRHIVGTEIGAGLV